MKRIAVVAAIGLAGCQAVGPDYLKPAAIVPVAYKEVKGWKPATPRDGEPKGEWWRVFHDAELSRLEETVALSNQTVKADEANYRNGLAQIAQARAALWPSLNFDPSLTRSGPPAGNLLDAQIAGSWTIDIWGKVRREIEENGALAQIDAATLDNARLSAQSSLAAAYVQLREADSLHDLYVDTVKEYQRALDITKNQYDAGTTAKSDVITAQAQVLAAQAQAINTEVQRQQSEHAIAVLMGKPPSELTVSRRDLPDGAPHPPVSLPSTLLERRPDIAGAERTMKEENAAIGVAIAGYYPQLSLSGSFGYTGDPFIRQIAGANPVWSYAASLAQPLFDGGLTTAQVASARASYDQVVATYRQTVLTAFQQVEDNLVAIRTYDREIRVEAEAVKIAKQAVQIALNEYRAGTQAFTTVVTAETTELSDELNLIQTRASRLSASVALIVALGGGYDVVDMPRVAADAPPDAVPTPLAPPTP
jgi:NodT family efflux transporter outer membrane factor (OMF) lipoprotein